MSKKVFIKVFGCQMNEYDSGLLKDILTRDGYEETRGEDSADVVIVNTCSVRQHAEDRACGYLREVAQIKKDRDITLAVMGCMAQREGSRFFDIIPELDIVCGVDSFRRLPAMLGRLREGKKPDEENITEKGRVTKTRPGKGTIREGKFWELETDDNAKGRVRQVDISRGDRFKGDSRNCSIPRNNLKGYVAVMRGCENFCSYCVVPGARGKEKSRKIGDILDEVKNFVERGAREVTLLGQNITGYGRDNGKDVTLVKLLSEVNKIDGLWRIRFITSHPRDIEKELFVAMRELEKVMEHLHLPLQAGSDRILKLMNRGYTLKHYIEIVEELRSVLPEVSLGTDIIVGFPGETDGEFRETLKAVEEIGFDMAYMYKYSPRPGTKAFDMEGEVPEEVIKERHQRLLKLQEGISLKKNRAFIGKEFEVLVEGRSKRNPNRLSGRDRGNRIVVFEGSDESIGKMVSVPIYKATSLTLYGETYRKGV